MCHLLTYQFAAFTMHRGKASPLPLELFLVLLASSQNGCPQSGYPLHKENRENGKRNPCQEKHRAFGNFAKTQGKRREFGLLKL